MTVKMAIEIMDLPIGKWWMFPSFFVIKTNPLKRRCHINQFSKKNSNLSDIFLLRISKNPSYSMLSYFKPFQNHENLAEMLNLMEIINYFWFPKNVLDMFLMSEFLVILCKISILPCSPWDPGPHGPETHGAAHRATVRARVLHHGHRVGRTWEGPWEKSVGNHTIL
jgi:hypothetical protein